MSENVLNRLFKGNHALVNQSQAIYAVIRQRADAGATRKRLVEQLSLPATTVGRGLDRLLKSGLIVESGLADSSGGRRPGIYRTVGSAFYLLGLALGEKNSHLALTDLHLKMIGTQELLGQAELFSEKPAEKIAEAGKKLLLQNQLQPDQVLGLGISPVFPEGREDFTAEFFAAISHKISEQAAMPVFMINAPQSGGQMYLELSVGEKISLRQVIPGLALDAGRSSTQTGQMIVPSPDKAEAGGIALAQLAAMPALIGRFRHQKDNPALDWPDFCQAVQAGKRKSSQIMHDASVALAIAVVNAALLSGAGKLLLTGPALAELPEYQDAIQVQAANLAARQGLSIKIAKSADICASQAIEAAAGVLDQYLRLPNPAGQ